MNDLSAKATEQLKAARLRYLSSLASKRDVLRVLRESLDEPQFETMMDLRHQAHKIAGSAGLYGLQDLQSAGAALDQKLRETNPEVRIIRELTDALIRLLDHLGQQ